MARTRQAPDQLNEIYPNLYLGDLTAAESPHVLEAYAITHIISLTSHRPKIPRDLAIHKRHFRIRDNTTANILAVLPECVRALEYILSDADGGVDALGRRRRVLVHCRMGMSRSGGAVVAYVMKCAQCPASIALEYVREQRPIVHPNRAFMAQLELWGACGYDTSFLEDKETYVFEDEAKKEIEDEEEEEDEEDEEALLRRAVEMSMMEEEGGEEEQGREVEMEETNETGMHGENETLDTASSPPPPQDETPATPIPSQIPLTPSPDHPPVNSTTSTSTTEPETTPPTTSKDKGKQPAADGEDETKWTGVVLEGQMKYCFDSCLRDVEGAGAFVSRG